MAFNYDGEDECVGCDKLSEVNTETFCKRCHDKHSCSKCAEQNNSCTCSDDRGDGDYSERGGYTSSYIDWVNNG